MLEWPWRAEPCGQRWVAADGGNPRRTPRWRSNLWGAAPREWTSQSGDERWRGRACRRLRLSGREDQAGRGGAAAYGDGCRGDQRRRDEHRHWPSEVTMITAVESMSISSCWHSSPAARARLTRRCGPSMAAVASSTTPARSVPVTIAARRRSSSGRQNGGRRTCNDRCRTGNAIT